MRDLGVDSGRDGPDVISDTLGHSLQANSCLGIGTLGEPGVDEGCFVFSRAIELK